MSDAAGRAVRTLMQFIVAGGLTFLVDLVADLDPRYVPIVQAFNLLLVTYAQNWFEERGTIPAMMKDQPKT